jgi:hypothetical protein
MQRIGIIGILLMSLTGCMAPGQRDPSHGPVSPPLAMTRAVDMPGWTPPKTYNDVREVVRQGQLGQIQTEMLSALQMTVLVDGCLLIVWVTPMAGGSSLHSSVHDPRCAVTNEVFLSRCQGALNGRARG